MGDKVREMSRARLCKAVFAAPVKDLKQYSEDSEGDSEECKQCIV